MILALDFGGVMHPVSSRTGLKFCRLSLVEDWLWARPGVQVLISSSWRDLHPLDELVSFFSEKVQPRIVGVAPVYERLSGQHCSRSFSDTAAARYPRQVEIALWLAGNDVMERRWVALDDDPTLFEPSCAHLVLCDPKVGLTKVDLEQLDSILGERPSGDGEVSFASMPRDKR